MSTKNAGAHSWEEKFYEIEDHPYPDYLPKGIETLVLGTFPSHQKNADFKFFYGGDNNQFWPLLASIYDQKLKRQRDEPAIVERKALLDKYHIGISDMVVSGYRYQGWSGDEHIFPIKIRDIFAFLDANPGINKLVFTSRTYIIGALGIFTTFLHQHDCEIPRLKRDSLRNLIGTWDYGGRKIAVRVPFSPSPRVYKREGVDFDMLRQMYAKCFKG